jgi:hypothetical protein
VTVYPFEFTFEARERIIFERFRAGNVVRGALGMALDADIFAPHSESGPSGFGDTPRPFVLRVAALEGRTCEAGERFTVNVNSFIPAFQAFHEAFAKVRWPLVEARELPAVELSLAPVPESKITIRFLTPTELKDGGDIVREPRFDVLFKRARDRVSALCSLYQGGAPETDYRALGEQAKLITLTESRVEQVKAERHSTRTGQTHSIGGFTGEADYEGELRELIPWLKAAEWTGVGRLTVWGNGALCVVSH